jgi:hypothetical protein
VPAALAHAPVQANPQAARQPPNPRAAVPANRQSRRVLVAVVVAARRRHVAAPVVVLQAAAVRVRRARASVESEARMRAQAEARANTTTMTKGAVRRLLFCGCAHQERCRKRLSCWPPVCFSDPARL